VGILFPGTKKVMNAREIEDYFESLNRASLVKLFTLLWRHRQQSLITLQRGPRFPVFLGFRDEWDL
jgi:hypothetical protein